MQNEGILPLIEPKVMAVYGVARDAKRPAAIIYNRMKNAGYTVIPVNPNEKDLLCSLYGTSEVVDLAVLAVSSKYLESAVRDCIDNKVKVIIVPSSDVYEAVKAIYGDVEEEKPRVLGPNSLGMYRPDIDLDLMIVHENVLIRPSSGNTAFISQSGFLALPLFEALHARSLGVSLFVDIGNAFDIDGLDLLEYLAGDEETDVVSLYLENLSDGRRFFQIAKKITDKKKMVLLKAGRTDISSEAVRSHTGELSKSSYRVLKGAAKQSGIVMAEDERELIDFTIALTRDRFLDGNKIAVMSTTGGMGVIGADAISESPILSLAKLPNATKKAINNTVPFSDSNSNPVDLSPRVDDDGFAEVLRILVGDEEVSGVLVYISVSPNTTDKLVEKIKQVYKRTSKPMIIVLMGEITSVNFREEFLTYGIDTYPSTQRAVRVLEIFLKGAKDV